MLYSPFHGTWGISTQRPQQSSYKPLSNACDSVILSHKMAYDDRRKGHCRVTRVYHASQLSSKAARGEKIHLFLPEPIPWERMLFMGLNFRHQTAVAWTESVLSLCTPHWMAKLTEPDLKPGMCLFWGLLFTCLPSPPHWSSLLCVWTCTLFLPDTQQ